MTCPQQKKIQGYGATNTEAAGCCINRPLASKLQPVHGFSQHCDDAGSCGITASTLYNVYVVAQDFVVPTPNLQTVPQFRLLDTSDASGGFTCTAGQFAARLKPDILPVSSSPGLPVSQLYGNWSAARYGWHCS